MVLRYALWGLSELCNGFISCTARAAVHPLHGWQLIGPNDVEPNPPGSHVPSSRGGTGSPVTFAHVQLFLFPELFTTSIQFVCFFLFCFFVLFFVFNI